MLTKLVPAPAQVTALPGAPVAVTAWTCGRVPDAAARPAARLAPRAGVGAYQVHFATADEALGEVLGEALGEVLGEVLADVPATAGGYTLRTTPRGAVVRARDEAGFHAAVTTLLQLRRLGDGHLPPAQVSDAPRYGWRGLSLDIARSFFPPAVLREVIDVLVDLKLNVLHLHLSDDQGWRIEIPSRPRLAEISGATAVEGGSPGFLTVAQFAALVDYAAARGVRVVPEIDLPGHTNAALHAIAELNPDMQPPPPYAGAEVGFSYLHADLDATTSFLADVLGDLARMSPDPYLHIGGDEALAMEPRYYREIVRLAAAIVRRSGKRPLAWQEGAAADMGGDLDLQYWNTGPAGAEPGNPYAAIAVRSRRDMLARVREGARVVLSPAGLTYFDQRYDPTWPLGQDWAGCISLEDAYSWDPGALLPGVGNESILGVEAGMWTEVIHTRAELFSMLLPRLAAFAEVAWTAPEHKDFTRLRAALAGRAEFV